MCLLQVQHLKEFIPQAFQNGSDLILDCEILLVDKNGRLLPFGTLGVHKVHLAYMCRIYCCLFVVVSWLVRTFQGVCSESQAP